MESDDSLVHASRSGLAEATPQGRRSVCSTDSNIGFTPLGALVRAGVCGGECGGAFAALAVRRGVCGCGSAERCEIASIIKGEAEPICLHQIFYIDVIAANRNTWSGKKKGGM